MFEAWAAIVKAQCQKLFAKLVINPVKVINKQKERTDLANTIKLLSEIILTPGLGHLFTPCFRKQLDEGSVWIILTMNVYPS